MNKKTKRLILLIIIPLYIVFSIFMAFALLKGKTFQEDKLDFILYGIIFIVVIPVVNVVSLKKTIFKKKVDDYES